MAPSDAAGAGRPGLQFDKIGKYKIVAKLGQGGMGQVFRAHDPILSRDVAIKTMSAGVLGDPDMNQRFLREAQSAARLNHPNVITLHEFGEDQGQFFMAMELLDGTDLKDHIRQRTFENLEDKLALMEQICEGLAYAHSMQVVHRDLKPANIQVQTNGRIKIMDFGLARLGSSEMTRAGMIMGTPNYMSPEQVRGERVDGRSDVFALGSVFYELCSGRRAFEGESLVATLHKVTDGEPPPLPTLCPDVPEILVQFIEKALEKAPDDRYQDAREMREALDVVQQVLDGSLDESVALASLREARTLIERPGSGPLSHENAPSAPDPNTPQARTLDSSAATFSRRSRAATSPLIRGGTTPTPNVRSVARVVGSGSGSARRTPSGQLSSVAQPAPPTVGSRNTALLLGGVVVAGALAAGVVLLLARREPQAKPSTDGTAASALVAVAVDSQLEVARKSLEYKDLSGAVAAAQKALRLDPSSAEAKQIEERAKAALAEVEAAVKEAREAAQAGETERGTRAVARVLEMMPGHPVAGELAAQFNSQFEGQALEASRAMKRAAEAAQKAGATSVSDYAEAARLSRQGEELVAKKQFTTATQRFLEARQRFEAARAVAAEIASRAARPTLPVAAPTAVATPPPAAATLPSVAPPPATVPPAAVLPPPLPQAVPGAADAAAVRGVIQDFKRAIEGKDLALYKSLRPGLSQDDERKLRAAFDNVRTQEVDFGIESLKIEGDHATVSVTRRGRVNGQAVPPVKQVFRLAKGPAGWTIRDIGQ